MILTARQIVDEGIIAKPEFESVKRLYGEKIVSYGPSHYGYDVRLDSIIKEPNVGMQYGIDICDEGIDAKWDTYELPLHKPFKLPAHTFVLGQSMETIHMPEDVFGMCLGRSTYARTGLVVNTTPLEPGWWGQLTIELSNTTPYPVYIYPGQGIAQLIFWRGAKTIPYDGKYNGQTSPTPPIL